nr:molybdopterin-binding protein [uncultured Merdimonas sp.]
MKLIRTEEAAGHVLCHDMTQIIPGVSKGPRFRKGHVVTEEDIPVLLSMGKENLYVWEKTEGILHEDEGAERLRKLCQNAGMHATEAKEGKIELSAEHDGLFQVDVERLYRVNDIEELMIATRHTNTAVKAGDKLAGMRVIPLVIEEAKLEEAEKAAEGEPLLRLLPWKLQTAGMITTGSEVEKGLIKDQFSPVVKKKLSDFQIEVTDHRLCGDDMDRITSAILDMKKAGLDLIVCTGGMSVDPDDRTPGAIKASGAKIVTYGAPVLPGAMLCLGYFDDGTPVIGLPGCVMYAKATIFDLLLPRLAAGVKIERRDIVRMGHGGLCLGCGECHYPVCPFGKQG